MAFGVDDLAMIGISGATAGTVAAGGSLLDFIFGQNSAKQSYEYNKKLARENRAWMERMSNTAHQREVKDLRAAGLNPILSATGGAGASTPSADTGATMETVKPSFGSSAASLLDGIKTALDLKTAESNIDNVESATRLNDQKSITEGHTATIRGIDAKQHAEEKSLGMEKAYQNARKAKAEADLAYARAMFDTSPMGMDIYSAKQHNQAYPGTVRLAGGVKGFKAGSDIPSYLLRHFDSSAHRSDPHMYSDWDYPFRYLSNKGIKILKVQR